MAGSSSHALGFNVASLRVALAAKKSRIALLFQQIAGLGVPAFMRPETFRKFLELLSQVDAEREKEDDIILRIEEMETRHRDRRERGKLERAREASLECAKDKCGKGLLDILKACFKPGGHEA